MNKLFLAALTLLLALSSCQSSKVKISGRFVGSEAKMVYLEQSTVLEQQLIDSVALGEDGNFVLLLENSDQTNPTLYHLVYDNNRIPLLLKGGDNVTVSSAGNALRNYTVEGSEESELLHKFNASYVDGVLKLNDIMSRLTANDLADDARHDLAVEYTKLKNEIKRQQLGFIVENKDHIAAIYALYQRLPGDANLFNGDSDVIYYRTVAEALAESYPDSHYLPLLRSQIARMDAQISLLSQVKETNFPEIAMPDMYGKEQSLSSLEGKVILLHFWSAAVGNSNAMNADLKEIYAKYHDQGFEIYQVGIDTSKALWINTIQEQQLPWISVSDLRGEASPAVGAYNVQSLPANFLIDREGNIADRNLSGEKLEQAIKKHI
ncbi:MAG: AhpC/TSA family protein [Alistipes sp.]|jgi:peroxiredoxin|nr:AhpC/TSA family protein [Alistipes sp.]MBQ5719059.1 AhpC/TSA family protein [Alistipes sp.]MBQ5830339.1 AhpC/TSA family protein [Alistipes sp.]MBQ6571906.1 AhpC/TSA family protein [Alistipes sp.]